MNKLTSHFISSMQGLLGRYDHDESHDAVCMELIRQAMLDTLGKDGCSSYPHIERRLLFSEELLDLWYLRSDIMAAVSSRDGELEASRKIRQITVMFEGLLPRGMMSRPTSLSSGRTRI